MLPSVTIHPPARTDHQDTVQLSITSLHLTTHCTLQGITQPHSTLLQAALPQRNIRKSHSPRQVLGSSGSSSHFPTPREDGPAASRWPAPCCSPELCPSAESPGAAQPLKPTPLRTQTLVCGCCAAFRIFFFPFPFFYFYFFPRAFCTCRCPGFLQFSLGAWEVFWNMPKLSAPCVRAARCHPSPAPGPNPAKLQCWERWASLVQPIAAVSELGKSGASRGDTVLQGPCSFPHPSAIKKNNILGVCCEHVFITPIGSPAPKQSIRAAAQPNVTRLLPSKFPSAV